MKNIIAHLLITLILSSCNKVTLKRLEGTWKVKEIKEIPDDVLNTWTNWLDTTEVKVGFYPDASVKDFYFTNDLLVGFSEGDYLLSEDDGTLTLTLESILFNPQGHPLDVTNLSRKSMTLEGRYYLNFINPSVPVDSFVTLRWMLEE